MMEGKPEQRRTKRVCGDGDPANKVKITKIIEVIEGKIGSATKVERSQAKAWSTGGPGTRKQWL